MEEIGILVLAYGSRAAAVIDALKRSKEYEVKCYVVDRQKNPFNVENAEKHIVIPDLNVSKICEFMEKNKERIEFGICCPEAPIMGGVRDAVEEKTGVEMICPTRRYAIEKSKILQRELLEECCKEANPYFKVFRRRDYENFSSIKEGVASFLDEMGDAVVVKPDKPTAGKGVGVWGDHFTTREQLFEHLFSIYNNGSDVIIEERLEGEESSFQAFCDGKNLAVLPDTRDYKRAFDGDLGPNTGGMGSYKAKEDFLPFMEESDKEEEMRLVGKIFKKLREEKGSSNEELRGMPFYIAFIHTASGAKILEINNRPGDPEILNVLPVLKNDFVDICFRMIEGRLSKIECAKEATVVTYAVPMEYGGYRNKYSGSRKVDLSGAYELKKKYGNNIRIYPGSMEIGEEGYTYALGSRTVCTVGIGETIEQAREISLEGIKNINGALWNRWDIASRHHIERSVRRMGELRGRRTWQS